MHPEAHEELEPARSIPLQEMSAPAAGTVLGGNGKIDDGRQQMEIDRK
jgi:hypothetical protein